jgi:uncharacterized membrane protein
MSDSSAIGKRKNSNRLAFLDWARGFAAVIMLQGHTSHSFTRNDLREGAFYVFSQFIGGITPAVFLFLTGVTLGFLMDSRARAGFSAYERTREAAKRSAYLFLLAFGFRLQLWLFAYYFSSTPPAISELFKVDILNCMGLAILLHAPMAVFDTRDRIKFAAISGIAIASMSPIVSSLQLTGVHPYIQQYFVPNPVMFPFFPWGAFVAFGLSFGSILRLAQEQDYMKVIQWAALFGFVTVFSAQYVSNLPYSLYPSVDFWLNSPALIFIKTGVILVIVAFAFLWTRYMNPSGWSFVRQLGTTSLLVYWVHTEIVYGSVLWKWKENLAVPQVIAAAILVITSMVALSVARTGWKGSPGVHTILRQRWTAWRTDLANQPAGD